MTLHGILKSFGATAGTYLAIADAPRSDSRDRGFTPELAVLPFFVPYYSTEPSDLAVFAAARDYHKYAEMIADEAGKYVAERYGEVFFRLFSDVSPFAEVRLSAMCGLGVIGDHRLLITGDNSSFVMLGEIVAPERVIVSEGYEKSDGIIRYCEHCGSCAAACPTGAIRGDGECLSAITQKKSALTPEEEMAIRENKSPWGCDRCAFACPHTKKAAESGTLRTNIPYFTEKRLTKVTADSVAAMTDEEYRSYPFSWRKREVLMRNLRLIENGKGDER